MKKIYFALFVLASLAFAGCSDFLEETAYDQFSKEEAFKSPTLVYLNTVASIYTNMGATGVVYTDPIRYLYVSEFSSDLGMVPGRGGDWVDGGLHQRCFLHTWTNSWDVFLGVWNDTFKLIGLCNSAIADLQEMLDNGGDAFLQDYINEVRAIRVYYYYHAINHFGRVPLVTSPDQTAAAMGQSERSAVYKFLCDEMCEVIPTLSTEKATTEGGEYYGRFNKATGYMLLAKLAINSGVFAEDVWYDGKFNGGIDKASPGVTAKGKSVTFNLEGKSMNAWETVIYCQEQLAAMGYTLDKTSREKFLVGNESSKETIYVRPNDVTNYRLVQAYAGYSYHNQHGRAFAGWFTSNGPVATVHAAHIFGGKATLNEDTWVYDEDWSEADPRWAEFCYYGPLVINGQPVPSGEPAPYDKGEYLTFWALNDYNPEIFGTGYKRFIQKWGGARIRKIDLDKSDEHRFIFHYTNADMVVYHYAEALLLSAEAKLRLGDEAGALALVNQVRARSGAPLRDHIDLQLILDERALELMWEPTRREDLVRFGMYNEPTEDKNENTPYAIAAAPWTYDSKGYHNVFPIPTEIMNLNPNFKQNAGYENNN